MNSCFCHISKDETAKGVPQSSVLVPHFSFTNIRSPHPFSRIALMSFRLSNNSFFYHSARRSALGACALSHVPLVLFSRATRVFFCCVVVGGQILRTFAARLLGNSTENHDGKQNGRNIKQESRTKMKRHEDERREGK